eukprot:SAG11_NODE_6845_length_1237_cov_1.309315_1_plen_209_part_00
MRTHRRLSALSMTPAQSESGTSSPSASTCDSFSRACNAPIVEALYPPPPPPPPPPPTHTHTHSMHCTTTKHTHKRRGFDAGDALPPEEARAVGLEWGETALHLRAVRAQHTRTGAAAQRRCPVVERTAIALSLALNLASTSVFCLNLICSSLDWPRCALCAQRGHAVPPRAAILTLGDAVCAATLVFQHTLPGSTLPPPLPPPLASVS